MSVADTHPHAPLQAAATSPVRRLNVPWIPGSDVAEDPAEPWEIPISNVEQSEVDLIPLAAPGNPSGYRQVPPWAKAALEWACGPLSTDRYFVVPMAGRMPRDKEWVMTPTSVVGFGDKAVGLWIDHGPNGILGWVSVDEMTAIEDRSVLLSCRLRLMTPDVELTVRYGAAGRDDLSTNLARLRASLSSPARPGDPTFLWLAPGSVRGDSSALPLKWRNVLESPRIRPDASGPVAVAVGDVASEPAKRPPSGLAQLTPGELVIASEPSELLGELHYGVDLLAVPRGRLRSLRWDGQRLLIAVGLERDGGAVEREIAMPLDPFLVDAMWQAFGGELPW